jgi:hypothetical protein
LEDLRDSNEITLFDDAFPAITGFELWIDQAFQWHYQSRDEPDGELRCIAAEAIKDATESRRRGSLEEAERLSGAAISADDMKLEPLAIRAARFAASKATAPASGSMAELATTAIEERRFKLEGAEPLGLGAIGASEAEVWWGGGPPARAGRGELPGQIARTRPDLTSSYHPRITSLSTDKPTSSYTWR